MHEKIPVFVPGQRWVSEAEPELGLGTVLQVEGRRATLVFPANGELRQYAMSNAPLNRVRFSKGDTVSDGTLKTFIVERVQEDGGLIAYHGQGQSLPEGQLNDQLAFNRPQDRLLNGKADGSAAFFLRQQALLHLNRYRSLPLRGLLGGRVELIPHQLYVVESVVHRAYPRVLLSDEIGLGKTIEACLILHRKLMLGRVRRALVLVPSALIHQWFVELLRRFSLLVSIFDEERCVAIESNPESGNPFLEDQLILCDVDWLASRPERAQQAVDAGWDLLIVDEAHHLEWEPDQVSPEYAVVERLSGVSHGLLLLTATPEEMGGSGHFARLRLLDPDRYASLEAFQEESEGYAPLVPLAEAIESKRPLSATEEQQLSELGLDSTLGPEVLMDELIDFYGPGRVIFRNTRRIIAGFPKRHPHLYAIDDGDDALLQWLIQKLGEVAPDKVLAIAHTKEEAERLAEGIKSNTAFSVGVFHEEMNLLQRDRQAAWFASPEGASVLVTSEIGGEGRNFQFAHHLVFLDIPENPEMIEQRIGRLDRIGQAHAIHIHVPYRKGTRDEMLARWVHESLDAFRTPLPGAHEIYMHFRDLLQDPPWSLDSPEWEEFLRSAKATRVSIAHRVARGRDRLLELHSYRADKAEAWVRAIREIDADETLQHFLLDLFESHGVHPEQLDDKSWLLRPDAMFSHFFPSFPRDGMIITFDRKLALAREETGFITWDHPLLHGAIERVITSPEGNAAMAVWQRNIPTTFLLCATFVVEATTSKTNASHYMPATPIRLMLDEHGAPWRGDEPNPKDLQDMTVMMPREYERIESQLTALLAKAKAEAEKRADAIRDDAIKQLTESETAEIRRLKALQKRNDHITDNELRRGALSLQAALEEIREAPLRLDSICWIWCGNTP